MNTGVERIDKKFRTLKHDWESLNEAEPKHKTALNTTKASQPFSERRDILP